MLYYNFMIFLRRRHIDVNLFEVNMSYGKMPDVNMPNANIPDINIPNSNFRGPFDCSNRIILNFLYPLGNS